MNKMIPVILLCGLIGFTYPCLAEEPEKEKVYQVLSDYYKAVNQGDLQKILTYYTDDVVVMPPFSDPSTGKERIAETARKTYDNYAFDFNYSVEEIIVAGDWAMARSESRGLITRKATGESVEDKGKAIHILKKLSGGDWKIARYIFNSSVTLTSNNLSK